jgi:hypothetical protein
MSFGGRRPVSASNKHIAFTILHHARRREKKKQRYVLTANMREFAPGPD